MNTIADRLQAQARIYPVSPANRVKEVRKLADGSMRVTQHSGECFTLAAADVELQAFVLYTVLEGS